MNVLQGFVLTPLLFILAATVSAHQGSTDIIVHMDEKGFDPATIEIAEGQSLMFENRGTKARWPASNIHPTHEIYPEFDPKKSIAPGAVWKFTFTKPGLWRMHDHLDPKFSGTVTVKKSAISSVADASKTEKGFWKVIWEWISGIFRGKKTSPSTENVADAPRQTIDPSAGPPVADAAKKYSGIEKDSSEIWSNEAALYAYIKKYGARQTFVQLDALEKKGVGDCHQTAHRAGRDALNIFGNEVFKECDLSCHSGCYHGATEEYFKIHGGEDIAANINTLCTASASNAFYNHQCLHGLGHGLMAWTNYELPEALQTCDLLKSGQGSCWTGVFMENIVGNFVDDKNTVHVTKYKNDDPQFPCTIVDANYKDTCYFLQTSRMMQMYGVDFKKIADACSQAPRQHQRSCFESMGRDVSSAYRPTPARSIAECRYAPLEFQISCLNGAVQDALWDISGTDTAITFCTLLSSKNEKSACYGTIIPRMREVAGNQKEKDVFCSKVEKEFETQCIQ